MKKYFFTFIAVFLLNVYSYSQCDPDTYNSDDIFLRLGFNWDLEDQPSLNYFSFNRKAILTDKINIHIPTINNFVTFTNPEDDGDTDVFDVSVDISLTEDPSQNNNPVTSNGIITYNLRPGKNTFLVSVVLTRNPGEDYFLNKKIELFYNINDAQSNDYNTSFNYVAPDETCIRVLIVH